MDMKMQIHFVFLMIVGLFTPCTGLQLHSQLQPRMVGRAPGPAMFWGKKDSEPKPPPKSVPKGKGGAFQGGIYDDEVDTVSRPPWQPQYAENGEVDLAAVGGIYYVAFIPFLLFFFAYANGIFTFGYKNGNF